MNLKKMENSKATSRQLWALYCITKKDYRNKNLSKEEAAKLISELGDKNYVKKTKAKKTLSEELLDYLYENFNKIFSSAVESLNYKSVVQADPKFSNDIRKFAFIGVGCGITYPVYRKNNNKLQEIDEAAHKYRRGEILDMFMSKFTKKEVEHYENIGCPLQAIWSQDQGMQYSYWQMVQSFAESKGLTMRIKSVLD